jgi:hypothetical protein
MSHFTKLSVQFQDLGVLQDAFDYLGFQTARNSQAFDYYRKPVGIYPLVIPKQGRLHADMYVEDDGTGTYSLHADSMDRAYLESLFIPQLYAQILVERFALQNGLFMDSTIDEEGTIEYRLMK